jgi:hypothetical protein
MKKIILLLFVLLLAFSSCEKDDICDASTPTTPRLVINFYDFTNPSVQKSVSNLKVVGDGLTSGVLFNGSETTNSNTISLPLKTVGIATTFRLILNSGNPNVALIDEDIIKFTYSTQELFVSRACGYKTIYILDPVSPFTHTDPIAENQKWIKSIVVNKNNITSENEIHIEIYF